MDTRSEAATWRRRLWLCLCLVSACGGSSGAPDAGPPLDFSAFDQAVDAFIAGQGLKGATAVVVHRDRGIVHLAGYGAFAPDRLFLIASASKILSVGVLMRLADQKLIDVDAPIGNLVRATWGDGKASITVAQMLSNSSGLLGLLDEPGYPPYLCQFSPRSMLTACARSIYQAADADRIVPPDTRFRYGGGQWQLAGGIAEVASGKSWEQLVRETYVEPCATASLGYTNQFSRAGLEYPAFFMANPANLERTENPSIEGGAYGNASDYAQILLMHLRGGVCGGKRVLSEAAVARMQQDRIGAAYGGTTPDPFLAGYGLGWWVDRVNAGVVSDPGAYGAVPWLDGRRGYGAFILLEATATLGVQLRQQTKPLLDAVFDGAQPH
jgi:CubicO group peptidase (beta-lactamase class C family)